MWYYVNGQHWWDNASPSRNQDEKIESIILAVAQMAGFKSLGILNPISWSEKEIGFAKKGRFLIPKTYKILFTCSKNDNYNS